MNLRQVITGEPSLSRTDCIAVLCHALNLTTEQAYINLDAQIDTDGLEVLEGCLEERRSGKPLSYITGWREFFSENFAVDENVLIPRPETEILVEEALRRNGVRDDRTIIDMGCGSGIIGAIMAKRTGSRVISVDVSPDALEVARKNAVLLGIDHLMVFISSDLFEAISPRVRFDMVLANLPYVTSREWKDLMADIRDFEPRLALDGGEDGLDVYRRLMASMADRLAPGGDILLEIGSAGQAKELGLMLEKEGFTDIRIIKDYANKERVLAGHG